MAESSPSQATVTNLLSRYEAGERDFHSLSFDGVTLSQKDLSGSHFSGCTFRGATLVGCTFNDCEMTDCDFTAANLSDALFRSTGPILTGLERINFHSAVLTRVCFEGAVLISPQMSEVVADSADFSNATLTSPIARNSSFSRALFRNAKMSNAEFDESDLSHADFGGSESSGTRFIFSQLEGLTMVGSLFHGADFSDAKGALDFENANLHDSKFSGNDLTRCKFRGAHLGATFDFVDFRGADLSGITVDDQTLFTRCELAGTTIERNTLDSLRDYGGLTRGQLRSMKIVDGFTELRSQYSGYWQWLHIMALTMFLFPYLVYAIKLYLHAELSFCIGSKCSTVASRLWTFVQTGGHMSNSWWPLVVFGFSLAYNLLRFILLAKTKSLELKAITAGFSPKFSLDDVAFRFRPTATSVSWRHLLRIAKWGFYLNLLLVLYNLWHFMQMSVGS